MAPEQFAGVAAAPAADWYSFGALLHEALTGHLPTARQRTAAVQQSFKGAFTFGPVQELGALAADLVYRDAARRPAAREVLQRIESNVKQTGESLVAPRIDERPFVGRESDLLTLNEAWTQALQAPRCCSSFRDRLEWENRACSSGSSRPLPLARSVL